MSVARGVGRARSFAVPFARAADGSDVRPGEGAAPFMCVDCGSVVTFRHAHEREGSPVRAHFAHWPRADCGFSEGEGEQHLRAKRRIVELVEQRVEIWLARRCPTCDVEQRQRLPERVHHASLEHRVVPGRRADVALFDDAGEVLAVIEVCETHAVDDQKRVDLAHLRWFEVSAEGVLAGETWRVLQDHLLPFTCRRCTATATHPFIGSRRLDVACPLPGAGSVPAVPTCASCAYFLSVSSVGITCWGSSR